MPTLTYTQPHTLPKLDQELLSAVPSLAPVVIDGELTATWTLSDDGGDTIWVGVTDLVAAQDEAAIAAVVAAHDPTPLPRVVERAATQHVEAIIRTTDDQPHEVFRFPCDQKRLYQASMTISGVDAANFVSRLQEGRFVWKRTTGNAVMVGITMVSNLGDAASATWAPNALPQGTEIVFTVKGALGRTIDWMLLGDVSVYAPDGSLDPASGAVGSGG